MSPKDFMELAIAEAKQGDSPYGAVIVKDDEVVMMVVSYAKSSAGRYRK